MPFKKGQSGNPNGRPIHPYKVLLVEALEAEGKCKKQAPMKRIAKLFYSDDSAALKILKTLVPELKVIDAKIDSDSPFRLILEYKPTSPKGIDSPGTTTDDNGRVPEPAPLSGAPAPMPMLPVSTIRNGPVSGVIGQAGKTTGLGSNDAAKTKGHKSK